MSFWHVPQLAPDRIHKTNEFAVRQNLNTTKGRPSMGMRPRYHYPRTLTKTFGEKNERIAVKAGRGVRCHA